jgi:hypothetical protein
MRRMKVKIRAPWGKGEGRATRVRRGEGGGEREEGGGRRGEGGLVREGA